MNLSRLIECRNENFNADENNMCLHTSSRTFKIGGWPREDANRQEKDVIGGLFIHYFLK